MKSSELYFWVNDCAFQENNGKAQRSRMREAEFLSAIMQKVEIEADL